MANAGGDETAGSPGMSIALEYSKKCTLFSAEVNHLQVNMHCCHCGQNNCHAKSPRDTEHCLSRTLCQNYDDCPLCVWNTLISCFHHFGDLGWDRCIFLCQNGGNSHCFGVISGKIMWCLCGLMCQKGSDALLKCNSLSQRGKEKDSFGWWWWAVPHHCLLPAHCHFTQL